ncbi:hypothetical protein PGT21_011934 [Puccinia graminis f. sp. tritici]|uniref:Uncharacterized protein n=1 Tax=Puccinia graminis f. sp. tritici TaxID=56615 RepID=A0A5B0QAL3_PUCGR|nr:hypothetical protein PGT21_011934 [Puccinia graminis f. sp. tritici]
MADAGAGSSDGKMVKIKPQDKSLGFDGNNVERFLSDYQLAARLDGASDSDMAQQVRFFVRGEEVKDVLETLDGFEPPNWSLLKVAMIFKVFRLTLNQNHQQTNQPRYRLALNLSKGFQLPVLPPRGRARTLTKNRNIIPDSPKESPPRSSSPLSTIPSDDLLENQARFLPRNGNLVCSTAWTPISTTDQNVKKTPKSNKNSRSESAAEKNKRSGKKSERSITTTSSSQKKTQTPTSRSTTTKRIVNRPEQAKSTNTSKKSSPIQRPIDHTTTVSDTSDRTQPKASISRMAETSLTSSNSDTASAQQPRTGFESLESSLPPINEDTLLRPQAQWPAQDQGVSPALINSRAASIALESNRSTPVPHPIEREQMPFLSNYTDRPPHPRPFMTTSLANQMEDVRQTPTPSQAPSPFIQTRPQEQEHTEIVVDNADLDMWLNLFNNQFFMFARAQETSNVRDMRFILTQAAETQDRILEIVGREETIRLSENWHPREELALLEESLMQTTDQSAARHQTHATSLTGTQQSSNLTVAHHPQNPLPLPTPTPEPEMARRRHQEITYPGHTQNSRHSHPPPPPPPTQPPPAFTQQGGNQMAHHHPYQQNGGHNRRHQPRYHQQVQYHAEHQWPQHPQEDWMGYERNWRAPRDQTTRVIEIGDFLMRAERVAGRIYRWRGRGQGRPRQQGGPHRGPQ